MHLKHPKNIVARSLMIAFCALASFLVKANPFDDVKYMFRGGVDLDDNGEFTGGSPELRCITKVGIPDHAWHIATKGLYSSPDAKINFADMDVTCAYANCALRDTPCIVMTQPVSKTNSLENVTIGGKTVQRPNITVKTGYIKLPNLLNDWTDERETAPCGDYTIIVRVRRDEAVNDHIDSLSHIFQAGYQWITSGGGIAAFFKGATGSSGRYFGIQCGSNQWCPDNNNLVPEGAWCEIAVVVSSSSVSVALCWRKGNQSSPLTWYSTGNYDCSIASTKRAFCIGGEDAGEVTFTRGTKAPNNKAKCFRGAFHTFAFWDRALTRDEVREALAASRPALVKHGFKNRSSDEFTGKTNTVAAGNRWEEWNPVFNSANLSASVSFNVTKMFGGLPQYLLLSSVPGKTDAVLDIRIDGNKVTTQSVTSGRTERIYVPGNLLAEGNHTITFTRTDSGSGDFEIDAFELRGSWQLGYGKKDGAGEVFAQETGGNHTFYLTDGDTMHLKRGYTANNGVHTTWLYFDIPKDLCDSSGRCRADAVFYTLPDAGSPATQSFELLVNGEQFKANVDWVSYKPLEFTIPGDKLTNGVNCIAWHKTDPSKTQWMNCTCYRLALGKIPVGTVIVLR